MRRHAVESVQRINSLKGPQAAQKWYFRRSSKETFRPQDVSGLLRSNNAEVLVAAAVAGRGIVLFPRWVFAPASFKDRKLVSLLTDWDISVSVDIRFPCRCDRITPLLGQRIAFDPGARGHVLDLCRKGIGRATTSSLVCRIQVKFSRANRKLAPHENL